MSQEQKDFPQQAYKLESAAHELEAGLNQVISTRTALYGTGVLFDKYCNMPAVSTMLEYFESGRCEELAGPTGAYNLYESEVRANLIIANLEEISAKLDQVVRNQYMLYTAVERSNSLLADIRDEAVAQTEQLCRIADNQQEQIRLAAVGNALAAATAASTDALKYIALIK